MKTSVLFPQSLFFHGRINLGRGDIGMAQHFLDRPQIGPALEQMSGKGVAQSMGFYYIGEVGFDTPLAHPQPNRFA